MGPPRKGRPRFFGIIPPMRPLLAFSFAALCSLSTSGDAAERSAVPEKYKWNTADLYPSDTAWAQAKAEAEARIPKVAAYQGRLGESAAVFHEALSALMDLDSAITRLGVYASMRSDEDTREGSTREMDQQAEALGVRFSAAVSYLRPEILALGGAKVHTFIVQDERLWAYAPWLEDLLRYEPHTLSAPEEKVASQAGMMASAAGAAFSILKNADLPYPEITLSTGEKARLDAQGYSKHRAAPDREDRLKVFKAFWSKFKEYERTFGTTLNAHLKTHLFEKEVRKFPSCLEAALFDSAVPTGVYHRLISDVHAHLPTLHRYLRLRQRMMGLEELGYEDLYASIVKKADPRFTPEEAQALVLEAVAPLGPKYAADLQAGFKARWVDWMPTTGKKSGAYSTGAYGVHPYQLQNFTGLYEEVSTLAHESGHSMHTLLSSRSQPYPTHDYKIFVAEVASTLNEDLLLRRMLAKTKDKDMRLFLLGSRLDDLRTVLYRQTLFAEFELRIHELAEKGEALTGEKVSALYLGLLREYYGHAAGVCRIDELYGVEWAMVQHFYYDFYVYQYATSITAAAKIASDIRAETPGARDAYLRMLSAGSSKPPIDLLKDAGVDMASSEPFEAAVREMNAVMDEIEALLSAAPGR